MTPIEIIRRKKNPHADSCLPPADRLPSLVEPAASVVESETPVSRQTLQDAIIGPIAPAADSRFQNPTTCDVCGCPAFWLSKRAPRRLRCGACQPPPFAALVDFWLIAVWVPLGPFGGGNVCEWETLRPRFDLTRLRKKTQPDL